MAALTHKLDYLVEGLSRNLDQFKGKPRFEAILRSWLLEIQALEDAAWQLYSLRLLQSGLTAGDLLDRIGNKVGQAREGFDDATFLRLVTARIKANRSNGRRETLIALALLLAPEDGLGFMRIRAREYTGAIVITILGDLHLLGDTLFPPQVIAFEFLVPATGGGVRPTLVWMTVTRDSVIVGDYKFSSLGPFTNGVAGYTYGNTKSYPNGNDQPPVWSGGGGAFMDGGPAAGAFTKDGGST